MEKLLSPLKPTIYALLRIVAGLVFAQHGAQKLFGVLGGQQMEIMTQMGLAGVIELFGGLAIAVGTFTSPIALLASGEMAWAYFQVHAPRGWWPIQNGGEMAVLCCWIFLFVAASGPGKWSMDGASQK